MCHEETLLLCSAVLLDEENGCCDRLLPLDRGVCHEETLLLCNAVLLDEENGCCDRLFPLDRRVTTLD